MVTWSSKLLVCLDLPRLDNHLHANKRHELEQCFKVQEHDVISFPQDRDKYDEYYLDALSERLNRVVIIVSENLLFSLRSKDTCSTSIQTHHLPCSSDNISQNMSDFRCKLCQFSDSKACTCKQTHGKESTIDVQLSKLFFTLNVSSSTLIHILSLRRSKVEGSVLIEELLKLQPFSQLQNVNIYNFHGDSIHAPVCQTTLRRLLDTLQVK